MQRFRVRAAAILIGLFLPALGVCASLAPPSPFLSFCPAEASGGGPCCEDEGGPACPAPDRDPASPRCHACEGLLSFSSEERPALRAPEAAPSLPAGFAEDPFAAPFSPRHLRALSESPPLHLLNGSLRN